MANKSGTSEQIINLPQGGGALKGMGETFSPDLHTGTGNFSVPITLPTGRNGFQPQINLAYSTGNGNGPFGLGWLLSVPGIDRKTSKGIPRYREEDVFLLSGAEDLIVVATESNYTAYRPRTEGLFALIRHYRDDQHNYWEVKSKDGMVSIYGTPGTLGGDPATIYDPDEPSHIFSWKLTETRDPFGNRIIYEYIRDQHATETRSWNQIYLQRIRYVDYTDERGQEQFLVEVKLEYETEREDAFSVYRSGFEIRTHWRCRQIGLYTHAGAERLVRTYQLTYHQAPYNQVSLLAQITVTGHDDTETEDLPPLQFDYTTFHPEDKRFTPVYGIDLPPQSLGTPDTDLVDLFGNGLPDIVQMNGSVRYWRNLGNGHFDLPRPMRSAPAGISLADTGVQFVDANGEGKADLMVSRPGLTGYFPTRFDGNWDPASFQSYRRAPSFNLFDPEVKLVDLDGDGVTDAIRSGTRLECYFQDPELGWDPQNNLQLPRRRLEAFPNVNFSDPRVRFADMSGDGLQDIVMIHDGNVEYWPYMGYGKWGRRISMQAGPRFPAGYSPRQILVGDLLGDGLADIIFVDHCELTIWFNQNGNRFSDPITIAGTPAFTDTDDVRLVDLYGTGMQGVLWSANRQLSDRAHYYFLDLSGGIKPYLLQEMNNNLGAVTRVCYRSSSWYYQQDAPRRASRWKSPLPFPVQVVASVTSIDEISGGKLHTAYSYHHGYWDGAEREFRGFGRVEQIDTQTFEAFNDSSASEDLPHEAVERTHYSPPTLTKTWFHQGPVGEGHGPWQELDFSEEYWLEAPTLLTAFSDHAAFLRDLPNRRARRDAVRSLRGSILRTELYALDGSAWQDRPYTVTESLFAVRTEYSPAENRPRGSSGYIFFPYKAASRTTQWERGNDPMTQFNFTQAYDAFGQATETISIACPRNWRRLDQMVPPTAPFLATFSKTVYAQSSDHPTVYIKDRVAKTTTYELLHQGGQRLSDIKNIPLLVRDRLHLIGQQLYYYDGEAFTGLSHGRIDRYGALSRSEQLVMTRELLEQAYTEQSNQPTIPAYLRPEGYNDPQGEYPEIFRDQQQDPQLAGYTYYPGTDEHAAGYYAPAERMAYDFQTSLGARGMVHAIQDPLGNNSIIQYEYDFLPVLVRDPLLLETAVTYDYRLFLPEMQTDHNGNRTRFRYSPTGLLQAQMIMGKEGEDQGDTPGQPSQTFEYDLLAFYHDRQPVSVTTIQREYHALDESVPLEQRDRTIRTVEFSDGFGRLLQTRTQSEEVRFGDDIFGNGVITEDLDQRPDTSQGRIRPETAPLNVIVSGWQIYDNKGRIVRKYEPFYDQGFDYQLPTEEKQGVAVETFYDPLGRAVRTLQPDGSEQIMVFGVPGRIAVPDLDTPLRYEPTPWETYTYDVNDNAQRSGLDERVEEAHWNTPASIEVDALGRTIRAVSRNRDRQPRDTWSEIYEMVTLSTYDIRGNLLTVIDPKRYDRDPGDRIPAFHYSYDLTYNEENGSKVWRIESMDAGTQRIVFDAKGQEIERRDSKGALILMAFDPGGRPTHVWGRDHRLAAASPSLRQQLIYGDRAGLTNPASANLNGALYQHYDEAGRVEIPTYDFKGNVLTQRRQVIRDQVLLPMMGGTEFQYFAVDWAAVDPAALLEARVYQTDSRYDALNRLQQVTYPEDVSGQRKAVIPTYNRGGSLQSLRFQGEDGLPSGISDRLGVHHIAYNARGQRTLIAYRNGLMTRYAYDQQRFWLKRMRTERFDPAAAANYEFIRAGRLIQDVGYMYDLAGNIVQLSDRSPGSGVLNTQHGRNRLDRTFRYDPIYRLIYAFGREHTNRSFNDPPWLHAMRPTNLDINATHTYFERFRYDKAGNLNHIGHYHPNGPESYFRSMGVGQDDNFIYHYHQGARNNFITRHVRYDDSGNQIQDTDSRRMYWNHSNELHGFRIQNGQVSLEARYLYDAGGQRVKKIVWQQGGNVNTSTYIDGVFEYHTEGGQANNSLHLMDDQQRIALVRVGPAFGNDSTPRVHYHLGDHLGSSQYTVDHNAALISREEYYAYGGTSFGSHARKRYRYSGKERDEESGYCYYGARYYVPWLGRWASCDPIGPKDHLNLFVFTKGNPIRKIDKDGTSSPDANSIDAGVKPAGVTGTPKDNESNDLVTDPVAGMTGKPEPMEFVKPPGENLAGIRRPLTEDERIRSFEQNQALLEDIASNFENVSAEDLARWYLFEWETHDPNQISDRHGGDMKSDVAEHIIEFYSPEVITDLMLMTGQPKGLGITNMRVDDLLRETQAARVLSNKEGIPLDIRQKAEAALKDKDVYRQLLLRDDRFSLFILGATMEQLQSKLRTVFNGKTEEFYLKFVINAIQHNAGTHSELEALPSKKKIHIKSHFYRKVTRP